MLTEISARVDMPVPAAEVFAALVTPDKLIGWLAESAEVNLEQNKIWLWGRYTPETPATRDDGLRPIVALEPGEKLVFEWPVRGATTTVELRVQDLGNKTQVMVRHRGLPQIKPSQPSMVDYWSHCLENLRQLLIRGELPPRIEYTDTRRGDVACCVEIDAPRDKVYEALIDPAQLRRYLGAKVQVDPEVGGTYDYGWKGGGPIKILELEPNAKLAFSWRWANEPETVATWTLEDSGGRTRLTVVHSGFAEERDSRDYYVGWSRYLYQIKAMLECGEDWQAVTCEGSDW